ncbi:MAG: diadenylate cyclase CdaA [bacterium]|nr:diadenylate cyclase CdaA [bacterium]
MNAAIASLLLAADVSWNDAIDLAKMVFEVAVFAILIYTGLRFIRETRGSGVIYGMTLLLIGTVVVWIVIRVFDLPNLAQLFDMVASSVLIALVVVFQPEIRKAILHLGDAPIFNRFFRHESRIVPRLVRAMARMSKERVGALIAIEREASLAELADNGITIDAELNSYLIESIFFPKSALHDGGIVVRDDRIVAASCLFPLSQDDIDKRLGTRHRAALGLSEETDAIVLVVSEETGRISTAIGGKLNHDLTIEQLEHELAALLHLEQAA